MKKFKFSKKHIDIFKKLGVKIVYLFGSQAEGCPGPMSDFDIGIVFSHPEKYKDNTLEAYNQLYDIFIDVLPKKYLRKRFAMRLHEFDIVFLQFAPIGLQFNAIAKGKVLYSAPEKKKFAYPDYKEYVFKKFADFEYFYKMRHQAILDRIWKPSQI